MIETIWEAVRATVAGFESKDGTRYEPSRDPFSFEWDPRGDEPAFFLDPPALDEGQRYVGGGGSTIARCSIWLSRPRSDEPDRQAMALATDCGELRRLIDSGADDWFVLPGSANVRLSTGGEPAVTVVGSLALMIDFEVDD